METVFRNQLVSRNQTLRGNVFAHSFPRNGPHVTVRSYETSVLRNFRKHCLLAFFFDHENVDIVFLGIIGKFIPDYTA
jgi:hypothetical protein